ncbi:NAD-dependent histone deacetylase sir2 [Spiromyces aspiralis]|uniref:NAD-dependent histone deacetylase sir2 n=1 Tax=Spiromyces aspiralis TaxID=68401 RepID=A0ACC1HSM6_9FUNG|nr:NAD-dependent histone deacetylase sir2 [Spiromyces aspiralis]
MLFIVEIPDMITTDTFVFEQGISVHSLLDVFDIGKPLFISSISELQLLSLLRYVLVQFCRRRPKIKHINTIQDVVSLLKSCKNIMILTGAGVSVSCGIPDFRSPNGIYTRLYSEFGLEDPQQMFDIEYFRETPELFYSFAKELYPSNFTPSPSHAFIKLVEERGKLLRNYTQNIDTLEHIQGIERVLNCHGSFATATCIGCGYHCKGSDIKGDIMAQRVPMCPRCHSAEDRTKGTGVRDNGNEGRSLTHLLLEGSGGIRSSGIDSSSDDEGSEYGLVEGVMKPDITFFGEKLPDAFDKALAEDRDKVDLLLVMGSSLKVAPVSEIMSHLPHDVPQIIINKTPILHLNFDVQLLGDADNIVAYLAHECGWELAHPRIPGGSTKSDEFVRNMKRPAADPPPVVEQIARRDGKGKTTVVMQEYEIPSHWHLFPQAIVTAKDLKVVCGEEYVRLESDASGYSSSSGSGNSSSDGDGRGKDGDNDDDEGSSDDESETGTPGDGNYK